MPFVRRERRSDAALLVLALVDVVLLAGALRMGAAEVRDRAGLVTTGANVAASLVAVMLIAGGIRFLRVDLALRRSLQAFALAGIALHAVGHLARLYHDHWWYDEVLHMVIPGFASVLGVRLAQQTRLFPPRISTNVRAASLAAVLAIALAGAWEIFEFTMDSLQGTREQDDLPDTMTDMIDGLVGALGAAAWCWQFPRSRRGDQAFPSGAR